MIPTHPWWRFGARTTLFHGASSSLLPRIRAEGLRPPAADAASLRDLQRRWWPDAAPPAHAWPEIERSVLGSRGVSGGFARGPVLYFSGDPDDAAGYARAFARDLGEIGYTLRRALELHLDRRLPHPAPEAHPILLEVELDSDAVLSYQPLRPLAERIRRMWHEKDHLVAGFDTIDAVFQDCSDLEFRCARPVPAGRIAAVRFV